jgi:hypothetical protein
LPQRDLQIGNWTGAGYILQDLQTGAGAYLIEGGYNGGTWEGCEIKQTRSLGALFPLYIAKNIQMQDFVIEMVKLAAQLLIAKTKAERDAIYAQMDTQVTILVGTLATIAQNASMSLGQMFAIEGCNCLEPKARLSSKHPARELDDTGFEGKTFGAVPEDQTTLLDLKGFPLGDVGCWQYIVLLNELYNSPPLQHI